jgi:hypothetical protein
MLQVGGQHADDDAAGRRAGRVRLVWHAVAPIDERRHAPLDARLDVDGSAQLDLT